MNDEHIHSSLRGSSVQLPDIGGDNELFLPAGDENDVPSQVAEIMRTQMAIVVEGNKENLAIQPNSQPLLDSQHPSQKESPAKKRRFIDRQENAERLGWDDTQEATPSGTSRRTVVEATQDGPPEEEDDVSEDADFQQDKRPIAQTTRRVLTSNVHQPRATQRPAKRARIINRSRETTQTQPDELEDAIERHNRVNAPPLSQIETYQAVKKNAKMVVARNPKAPRARISWSTEETERLLDLIQDAGTSWSLLLKLDEAQPDPKLQERDQVALKDKANNMKMDYLK